jgi:hypothetical protein
VGPVCYNASSNPGDGVLDPFCSCETATEATQRFGCRWVAFRGAVRHRAALWNKAQRHQGYYWCSNRRKLSTIEKNGAGEIAAAATLPAPVSRVVPAVADLSSIGDPDWKQGRINHISRRIPLLWDAFGVEMRHGNA